MTARTDLAEVLTARHTRGGVTNPAIAEALAEAVIEQWAGALVDNEELMRAVAVARYGHLRSDAAQAAGANLVRPFVAALASALRGEGVR